MSVNDKKVSVGTVRPKEGQDRKKATNEMPQRTRLSGHRDMLAVDGLSKDYEYRYVKDVVVEAEDREGALVSHPGQRINKFLNAGWQFVTTDQVEVSQANVYNSGSLGSIVRLPAGRDEYLYLMRIRKDWFEEDKRAKARERLNIDEAQTEDAKSRGLYGAVTFE